MTFYAKPCFFFFFLTVLLYLLLTFIMCAYRLNLFLSLIPSIAACKCLYAVCKNHLFIYYEPYTPFISGIISKDWQKTGRERQRKWRTWSGSHQWEWSIVSSVAEMSSIVKSETSPLSKADYICGYFDEDSLSTVKRSICQLILEGLCGSLVSPQLCQKDFLHLRKTSCKLGGFSTRRLLKQ